MEREKTTIHKLHEKRRKAKHSQFTWIDHSCRGLEYDSHRNRSVKSTGIYHLVPQRWIKEAGEWPNFLNGGISGIYSFQNVQVKT